MPTRFANRVCPLLSVLCMAALLPAQDATSVRSHLPAGCSTFAHVRGLGPALAWLATSPWFEDGLLASLGWPADPLRKGLSHLRDLLPPDLAIGCTQESPAAIATMLEVATLADVLAVYRAHGVDDAEAEAVRARLLQRLQQPLAFGVVVAARAADAGTAAAWIDTPLLAMVSGQLVPFESRPDGDDAVIDISLWQFGRFYDLAERLRQLGIEPDAQLWLHQRCRVRGRDAVWQWTVDRSDKSQRLADGGPEAAPPAAFTIDARFDLAAAQAAADVALRGADERIVESATPVRLRLPAVAVVSRPRSVDDGWTFADTTTAKLLQSLRRPPAGLVELDLGLGVPTRVLPWTALLGDHGVRVEVEGEARLHWCQRGDLLVCSSSVALTRALLAASAPGQASTSLLGCASLPAKGVAAQVAALFSLPEEIAHGSLEAVAKALGCRVDDGEGKSRLRAAWAASLGRTAGCEWRRELADGAVRTTANWPGLGR